MQNFQTKKWKALPETFPQLLLLLLFQLGKNKEEDCLY